jgi:hypothetical protein
VSDGEAERAWQEDGAQRESIGGERGGGGGGSGAGGEIGRAHV